MKNGDRVGVVCTPSGVLLFYVNGQLKGKLLKEKIPKLRYALVDLYGCCDQVKLLPLEKAPTEREFPKKSVCSMVQLKGNLIHACGCVSRIAWMAMRAPAISCAGIRKPIISIAQYFISKYGAI